MVIETMMEPKKQRSFICSWLPSAILLSAFIFIGSSFLVTDYKRRFLGCTIYTITASTKPKICENECRPDGTEALPRGIVSRTTDLEMRPLYGPPKRKRSKSMSLLAIAVGIKQKESVNKIIKKFPLAHFEVMLFHYDGNVNGWSDLEWSNDAIHVSAINQTKWWFAKRYLHPDVVARYDYVFLWDEDLGVENFHAARYLSVVRKEGLHISQPGIDPEKSDVHYKLTARKTNSTVHRTAINLKGPGRKCNENNTEPPCTGFVEMMAPVFSRESWRCVWYMIQNDLVHAWGLDFQLGYCAQGDRTRNIGIVDSEYIVHLGLPTLGGSAPNPGTSHGEQQSEDRAAVRRECYAELERFKNRWKNAVSKDECWVDPFRQPKNQEQFR